MKTALLLFLPFACSLAQLGPATGNEFSVIVYHDTHIDNGTVQDWTNSGDWVMGANGRGPGGVSALTYWNVKAVSWVGDYNTGCDAASMAVFDVQKIRIAAVVTGVYTRGNHDFCAAYLAEYALRQSATFESGPYKFGIIGIDVNDHLSVGTDARIFADAFVAANPDRQVILIQHALVNGDSWCGSCAGYDGRGVEESADWFVHQPLMWWAFSGHVGGIAEGPSSVADDNHTIHGEGNNGNDGGGKLVTVLKFQPSLHQVQAAVYASSTGLAGTLQAGPWTWSWTPLVGTGTGLWPLPCPVPHP